MEYSFSELAHFESIYTLVRLMCFFGAVVHPVETVPIVTQKKDHYFLVDVSYCVHAVYKRSSNAKRKQKKAKQMSIKGLKKSLSGVNSELF